MRKFLLFVFGLFVCTVAFAQTIRWHVGDSVIRTDTCSSGDSITPPTAPSKTGYNFVKWVGYMPIEYLESTGTQYIDTGVIGNLNTSYEITVQSTNYSSATVIFGARTSATQNSIVSFYEKPNEGNNINILNDFGDYSVTRQIFNLNNLALAKITIINNKNLRSVYIWDTQQTNTVNTTYDQNITTPSNLYIGFASANMPPQMGNFIGKIFSCKIYDNGTLIRDFAPALDGNSIPCMYEKVEKKYYYNQGTGNFIAGPVVSGD